MIALRHSLRPCFRALDAVYRRNHQLRPVPPLLHVGLERYSDGDRRFEDGTLLRHGDPLGTLHFDNARIATLDPASRAATGLGFTRMLFASLYRLAALSLNDPDFRQVQVYRGVGCNRHGGNVGFLIEPLAEDDWHARFIAAYTRILVWAYTPSDATASTARPTPTVTWLTRDTLIARFGAARKRRARA
jgi:hypothetical protein